MKKIALAGIAACIVFFACKDAGNKSTEQDASAKSELTIPDSFFIDDGIGSREDTTIPSATAKIIIDGYAVYMQSLGVDTTSNQLTRAVSFNGKKLQKWLKDNDVFKKSDELRIFFGRYPDLPAYGANRNRLTIILWPYKGGNPAKRGGKNGDKDDDLDPFNLGNLKP